MRTPVDARAQHRDLGHGRAGSEVDTAIARGFFQRAAQLARIDADLGQEKCPSAKRERRLQAREFGVVEQASARAGRHFVRGEEGDGANVAQVGRFEGFLAQLADELGILARARGDQGCQLGRIVGIAMRDHAARSMGGFARRLAFLDYKNAGAAVPQAPGQRQPDDARADDDEVPSLHASIVVEERNERGCQPELKNV